MFELSWLREQLKKPGLSQGGLARAMGKDTAAINRMLKGERQIKANEVATILAYVDAQPPAPVVNGAAREAAFHRAAHQVMAALHEAMAQSGDTYATLASKLGEGWSEAEVRLAFFDEGYWRDKDRSLLVLAAMVAAMDRQIRIRLEAAQS